jgi:hypothetical protein
MSNVTAYIVRKGSKYLSIDNTTGIRWCGKQKAFLFFSVDAALQIACALTSPKATLVIMPWEEGE